MSEFKTFQFEACEDILIIIPTRNVSTLADDDVTQQLSEIRDLLIANSATKIIFDLEKVDYFGSSMLEAMLKIRRFIDSADHAVTYCGATETCEEVMKVARFNTLWRSFPTRQAAIDALRDL